uniref:Uncharacterized protein n=1 Tax=Myripristis murdjan TaxID=586833 RepID=A0A667Y1T2_9TELE
MQNMQEFIPFAKEMLSQKPSRGLLKVYLVGSVFAVCGNVVFRWRRAGGHVSNWSSGVKLKELICNSGSEGCQSITGCVSN